ncbi:MAG: hypothetical protein GTN70_12645 [Deltaproteobacteria bacterium]|nr:hypothetical protein [Deltaproteobacteria bacterium]NIS78619.1 hypothetical protein [Deltaproteobacteria bacterium]
MRKLRAKLKMIAVTPEMRPTITPSVRTFPVARRLSSLRNMSTIAKRNLSIFRGN